MQETQDNYGLLDQIDFNKLDWHWLCENPNAIEMLKANPDKINWELLSYNPNPISLQWLSEAPDKIDWFNLSRNPNAISLLESNPDKIRWSHFAKNPAIFKSYHEGVNEYVLK